MTENIVFGIEESRDLSMLSVKELFGLLRHMSSVEGKRSGSHLIKHFKQSLTLREKLGTLKAKVIM